VGQVLYLCHIKRFSFKTIIVIEHEAGYIQHEQLEITTRHNQQPETDMTIIAQKCRIVALLPMVDKLTKLCKQTLQDCLKQRHCMEPEAVTKIGLLT